MDAFGVGHLEEVDTSTVPVPPDDADAGPRQRLHAIGKPGHGRTFTDDESTLLAALGASDVPWLILGHDSGAASLWGVEAECWRLHVAVTSLNELGLLDVHEFTPQDARLIVAEGSYYVVRSPRPVSHGT